MRAAAFLVVLSMLLVSAALADVPGMINYQGTLTDDDGVVLNTTVAMTFTIYYDSTGAGYIWTETQASVVVTDGIFNVLLGSVNPLSEGLFGGSPSRWLGVRVGGDPELVPRQRIVTVAHAFHAAEADTADYAHAAPAASDGDWTITGSNMYAGVSGNVGIGITTPETKVDIDGAVSLRTTAVPPGAAGRARIWFDGTRLKGREAGSAEYNLLSGWKISSSNVLLDDNISGNVGIGTATPAARLDCPGPVRIGSPVSAPGSAVGLMLFANDNTFNSIPLAILNTDTDPLLYVRGNGDVGVGTFNPAAKLDVVGTARMTGFTLPTGAASGKVLTSDASGNGTWQAGFTGLWADAGVYIRPDNASNFTIYDNSSSYVGLSYVNGTETDAITYWLNDGASVNHCYKVGSNLYGTYASVSSGLTDYGVRSFGQEWGGYFGCSPGGTAVYGEYDSDTYGTLGTSSRGVYGQYDSDTYGYLGAASCGAFGQYAIGTYGYLGYSGYGIYGHHTDGNYGYIGSSSYGMYANLVTTDVGDYAIYGYGVDASGEDGTGYGASSTLGGVKGYNYYGNPYTFGVAGYSYLDYNRSGGCFGANYSASTWGSLCYKNSGGTTYGGYATSWGSGTGKDEVSTGIGLGAWGDLFGADIHGKVYGAYVEGGDYALYSNGDLFRNGMDVHLQETGASSMAVLYTNVSTDVTVQTSGFAALSGGKSVITFDEHFRSVVSPEVPVVVTVTPTGPCQGVYVSQATKDGFTVVENGAGKSDVQVAFIAVGRRVGYENPQLPQEVVSADYVDKLSRGLHNDADTQSDGEGLFFEAGELVVGVHPSTLPDPNKPAEELEPAEQVTPPDVLPLRPAEVGMERPPQDNRSSEQIRTRQSD